MRTKFIPYTLEDYKTVKQWKKWLSQFDDDCKVETILKEGDAGKTYVDAWTTGMSLYFEVSKLSKKEVE